MNDAGYRTDDAWKAILVSGEYLFEGCNQRVSYSQEDCFEQLRGHDGVNICIRTSVLICSYLHHSKRNTVPRTCHGGRPRG